MSEENSPALEHYRAKLAEFEKARREVERVRKEAIDELLKQRREVNAQLRQLGYDGDSQDGPRRAIAVVSDSPAPNMTLTHAQPTSGEAIMENGHKRRRLKGGKTFDAAFCSICQLAGHDLRAHRGQGHKRAFSSAELRERGLAAQNV